MNPFVDGASELSEAQLIDKIEDLSRKYFMTSNPQVREQMASILDMYKLEFEERKVRSQQRQDDDNKDLDNLININ
jgi:hypothetical protein